MNVKYSDRAGQVSAESALLQRATKQLQEVLGQSAEPVTAEWDRSQDGRGHVLYTLRLSAFQEEVSATFTPDELRSPRRVRSRLLDLWGDLLQAYSDKQVKKLQQLVAEGE